jgi:hypothetical protein
MKSTRKKAGARVVRERENLETMVRLFCHCQHHGQGLCPECQQLLNYSKEHLESCRWGFDKPVCDNCSFQCFLPACREKIQAAIGATKMHMLWQHPQMSLRHWVDSLHHVHAGALRQNYSSWGAE